jgi:hypothetical protein
MTSRVVLVALVLGCGSTAASGRRSEYMTLRTAQGTHQMTLATNGEIVGPTMQLTPTNEGYRGMADSSLVDLRSDGERIVGTIANQIVDLHVSLTDDGLLARGLFGGRLGRLDASNIAIKSTLGICHYELQAVGSRYQGERACRRSAMPVVHPAVIELPPGFERLNFDRQMMVLAILLSQ